MTDTNPGWGDSPANTIHSVAVQDQPNATQSQGTTRNLSRDHILDAAEHCFNHRGYDGLTIRAIAKQLDCAVGSIYRYFKDKRQMMRAMTARLFQPIVDVTASQKMHFHESLRTYVDCALDHPEAYRLMFWLASLDEHDRQTPEPIIDLIHAWSVQLGNLHMAQQTWAVAHGLISLNLPAEHIVRLSMTHHTPTPNTPTPETPNTPGTPNALNASGVPGSIAKRSSSSDESAQPAYVDKMPAAADSYDQDAAALQINVTPGAIDTYKPVPQSKQKEDVTLL